jgi:hypothetical protein
MDFRNLPFADLLEPADINALLDVRERISPKYQRNKRISHFDESLAMLRACVHNNRASSWKRALVCGVCQCDDVLAVNNYRLQLFSDRSKSSINGLFAQMGYRTVAINRVNQSSILAQIPFLAVKNDELRQWTYRVKDNAVPIIPSRTDDVQTLENSWTSLGESGMDQEGTWIWSEDFGFGM